MQRDRLRQGEARSVALVGAKRAALAYGLWIASLVGAATAPAAPGASWTQPGHDATHGSFNPDETTITAANVGELVELWHVDGIESDGAPVVSEGRVFVTTRSGRLIAFGLPAGG